MQVHALFAASDALTGVASLRAELDRHRAARFALHVTVAYAPTSLPTILEPRVSLDLGDVAVWPEPHAGIYLPVRDPQGWLSPLREQLGEPESTGSVPHVTLLHHRARRGGQDLDVLRRRFQQQWTPSTVEVVALVAVDEVGTVIGRVTRDDSVRDDPRSGGRAHP